jgi:hypothetical protein
VRALTRLWERQATYAGDQPPEALLDALRTGVEELIEQVQEREKDLYR